MPGGLTSPDFNAEENKVDNSSKFNYDRYAPKTDGGGIDIHSPQGQEVVRTLTTLPIFGQNERYNLTKAPKELQEANKQMLLAKNQSWYSQLGNMVGQAVIGEIIGQGIAGIGALADIPEAIIDRASGNPHEFRNALTDFGNSITDWSSEKMPIYRMNLNQAFDVGDSAWWFSNGVSVASTLSLLIPGLGTSKGVSYAGKFLGAMNKISKTANVAGKANVFTKIGSKIPMLGQKGEYWRDLFSTAVGMRHAENFREASGVVVQTKKESLDMFNQMNDQQFEEWKNNNSSLDDEEKGMDREQLANKIASEAAWRSYDINSVNLIFDVLQARLLFGLKPSTRIKGGRTKMVNTGGGKTSINMAQSEVLGEGITNGFRNKIYGALGNLGRGAKFEMTEGAEEFINFVGQQEGLEYGKQLLKTSSGKDLQERMSAYLQDPHAWEAAFWGVAGGAVFTKGSSALGWAMDKMKGKDRGAFEKGRISEIQGRATMLRNMVPFIETIQSGINPYTKEEIKGTDQEVQRVKAELIDDIQTKGLANMWSNAASLGNADLLEQYFAHPNFIKNLQDEYKMTDTEAVKFSHKALTIGKDVEAAYNKYVNVLAYKNTNEGVKNLILNNAVAEEVQNKQLQRKNLNVQANLAKLKEEDTLYQKLREVHPELNDVITGKALGYTIKQLNKELKNEDNDYVKKLLSDNLTRLEDKKKLLDELNKDTEINDLMLKGINPEIISGIYDSVYLDLASDYLSQKTAYETSDEGVKKTEKVVEEVVKQGREQVGKEYKEKLAALQYTDDFEKEIDTMKDEVSKLDFKISDLDFEKKRRTLRKQKEEANQVVTEETKVQPTEVPQDKTEEEVPESFNVDYAAGEFNVEEFGQSEKGKAERIESLIRQNDIQSAIQFIDQEIESIKTDVEEHGLDPNDFVNLGNYLIAKRNEIAKDTPTKDDDDIQLDVDFVAETIRQQGGKEVLNVFLAPFIYSADGKRRNPINNNRSEDGDVVITDGERAATIDYILNKVNEGMTVNISIDTNNSQYNKNETDPNNVPLKINVAGTDYNIAYANRTSYLNKETILTQKLFRMNSISQFVDPLYDDIIAYKNAKGTQKQVLIDKLKANDELIELLKGPEETKKKVRDTFATKLNHLVNILFFGKNIYKDTVPTDEDFKENISNWNEKMQRDIETLARIRRVIGTDTTKVVEAKIVHKTSGAVLTSRTESGTLIYRALNETIGKDETDYGFDLFSTVKDSAFDLAPMTTGQPEFEITNLKNRKFVAGREYLVLKSGQSRIAVPAIRTTLSLGIPKIFEQGQLSDTLKKQQAYSTKLIDKVVDYLFQLREPLSNPNIKLNDATLTDIKNNINELTIVSEKYPKNDTDDDGRLKIIVGSSKVVQFDEDKEKTVDNRVQFKHNGKLVRIFYTKGKSINVEYNGEVISMDKVGEPAIKKKIASLLGGLERNVIHSFVKADMNYVDPVTGEMKPYKNWLIDTGAIVTNVGKVLDNQRNKISNFTNDLTNNRSTDFVGFPLIINIKPEFEPIKSDLGEEIMAGEEDTPYVKFAKSLISRDMENELLPVIEKYNFLYEDAAKAGITVEEKLRVPFKDEIGNLVRGGYVQKDNNIFFTQTIRNFKSDTKLIIYNHEIIHGVVKHQIKDKADLYKKLEDFWKTISLDRKDGKAKVTEQQRDALSTYLFNVLPEELSDIQKNDLRTAVRFINDVIARIELGQYEEIVTYGLSHPTFAAYLDSMRTEGEKETSDTVWGKLKKLIVEIYEALTGRSKLDELVDILDSYKTSIVEEYKNDLGKTENKRKIDDAFGDEFDSLTDDGNSYQLQENGKDLPDSGKAKQPGELRTYVTPGFTVEQENHLINVSSSLFFSVLQDKTILEDSNITLKGGDGLRIAILNKLKKISDDAQFYNELTKDQVSLFAKYIGELKQPDSELWDKTKTHINNEFGISPESLEQLSEQILEKNWNDTAILEMSNKDNVLNSIKLLILTTPKADATKSSMNEKEEVMYAPLTNTLSGLGETVSFNVVFNTIQNAMLNRMDKYEMLDGIKFLAQEIDPSYYHIYYRVRENEQLLNAWYYSFNKQKPRVVIELFRKQGDGFTTKVDYGNKKSLYETQEADKIIDKLTTRIDKGYYTEQVVNEIEAEKNKIVNYLNTSSNIIPKSLAKQLVELYKKLGVDLDNGRESFQRAIEFELTKDSNIRKAEAQLPKEVTAKAAWITRRIAMTKFVSSLDYLLDYIKERNDNPNEEIEFNQYGNILSLAAITAPFNEHRTDNTYMNVKNNLVQSTFQPDFISEWFKHKKDEETFFTFLLDYAKEPGSQYYNWLWANEVGSNQKQTFGLINYRVEEGVKVPVSINDEGYRVFDYVLYGGSKNITEGKGAEYTDMLMDEWQLRKLIHYFNSINKTQNNKLGVTSFGILPSDRGRNIGVTHNKVPMTKEQYEALSKKDFTKFRDSNIYKAVYRTMLQEYERMLAATKFMFLTETDANGVTRIQRDELGNYIINPRTINDLVKNYHYKEGVDGNKQSIKLGIQEVNGRLVLNPTGLKKSDYGNVFRFNNIPQLNTIEGLFDEGLFVNEQTMKNNLEKVKDTISIFIRNISVQSVKQNKHLFPSIEGMYEDVGSVNHAVSEYAINHYIAKTEMANLFGLVKAFYKNDKDIVKRATQMLANGNSNAEVGTFRAVTIADAYWQSENIKAIKKAIKDGTAEEKYKDINLGDAQSYITLDEYKKRLQINGKYEQFKDIIEKLEKGKKLTSKELIKVLSPLKEFYYSFEYDSSVGMHVPVQVKNSAQVLIPFLIRGTALEQLAKMMNDNNIQQVNFASAEKVGSKNIVNLTKKGKMIKITSSNKKEFVNAARSYHYENLRTQQEVPYHIKDTQNKLGVQIARKILDNIQLNKKYGKLTGKELSDFYFKLLNANIVDSSIGIMDELDVVYKDGDIEANMETVLGILLKEAIETGLDNNALLALKPDVTGHPIMPLYFGALQSKWMSILTSLFTNNVTNQKFPGLHAAQMSNVFMEAYSKAPEVKTQQDYTVPFRKLKSQVLKENEIIEAEVLLPAWSKQFYDKEGKLISIEELEEAGLNKMLGYRIPTEGKYSTIVFKVVGFLPEEMGATIVIPDDFVTQSGSDFDIDSIYTMLYQFEKKGDKFTKIPFMDESTSVEERMDKFNTEKVDKEYKSEKFTLFLIKELKNVEVYGTDRKLKLSERSKLAEYIFLEDGTANSFLLNRINKARYSKQEGDAEVLADFIPEMDLPIVGALKQVLTKYNAELREAKLQDFKARPIEFQNTRAARNNQILDLYFDVLQSSLHYKEVVQPNSFEDITEASKHITSLLGVKEEDYNLFTDTGDAYYRNRVMEGRTLKGHSVNRDGFLSIAQFTKMSLRSDLGIKRLYKGLDAKQIKNLKAKYGESAKDGEKEGELIINHTMIGWNAIEDDYTNVEGKLITNYSAQSTSNILDNVKDPLPQNVSPYTFGIWRTFTDVGLDWKYSTTFIRQPILKELSDYYLTLVGVTGEGKGREIETIKRDYQTKLYEIMKANKKLPKRADGRDPMYYEVVEEDGEKVKTDKLIYGIRGFDESIKDGDGIYVERKDTKKTLGYNPDEIRAFSQEELDELIKHSTKLDADKGTSNDANKDIAYYRSQLQILESFRLYKKSAEGIEDMTKATNVDKIGAGPDLIVTHDLRNTIIKVDDYKDNEDDFAPLMSGSRIRISGGSAIRQVYPLVFKEEQESVYPPLEEYLYRANFQSLTLLGKLFISETNDYVDATNSLLQDFGRDVNSEKLLRKINGYINAYLLSDHPFYNIGNDEWRRLLGLAASQDSDFNLKDEKNLEKFQKLPVSIKLEMVKEQLTDEIKPGDVTQVLNYIQPSLNPSDKYLKLNWLNNDKDNYMIESFNNLYYSNNPFIRNLAVDLMLYAQWESGMNYTYNSWSKIIPVNILNQLKINEHLEAKFVALDAGRGMLDENFKAAFKSAYSDDPTIAPTAYTKRYKKGEKKGQPRKGYPNWTPKSNGIIRITKNQLEKEPDDLQRAQIIKILSDEKVPTIVMSNEGQYDKVVKGIKTSTTRHLKFIPNVGDKINAWNGIKGKGAAFIAIEITDVKLGSGREIYKYIDQLSPDDEHFKREGREDDNLVHKGNLKKLEKSSKQAGIIHFKVISKSQSKAPIKNSDYTLYRRYEVDENTISYYPVSKLEPFEFGTESIVAENNVAKQPWEYIAMIDDSGVQYDTLTGDYREEQRRDDFYANLQNFIKEYRIDIMKDLAAYAKSGTTSKFYKDVLSTGQKLDISKLDVDDWADIELREALIHIIRHNIASVFTLSGTGRNVSILDKLNHFENMNFSEDEETKNKELTKFLWNAKLFTEGMLKIKDLTLLEQKSKSDVLDIEGARLNDLIKTLKEQYAQIEGIDRRLDRLFLELRDRRIASTTSNPEIQAELKNAYKPTKDLNDFQRRLDALMDVDNPVVANFAKFAQREMNKARFETYDLTAEFNEAMDKFLKAGGKWEDLLEVTKTGENTGKWLQEYAPEFYDELKKELEKLRIAKEKGIESLEYEEAKYEWEQWRANNLEQEFTDNYYKIKLLLTPATRQIRNQFKKERNEILDKYRAKRAYFDYRDISIEDRKALRAVRRKEKEYQDVDKHPEIATSWNAYNAAIKDLKYTDEALKARFFDDYIEAKAKGVRHLNDFLIRNTQPSDKFWDEYNKITSELYGETSAAVQQIQQYIDDLLEPYKDDNGLVIGNEVPQSVMTKVYELEKQLEAAREDEAGEFDEKKQELYDKLEALRKYVPTEYYYLEVDKQLEKLRKKGVEEEFLHSALMETKWYKQNHKFDKHGHSKGPKSRWTKMVPVKNSFVKNDKGGYQYWYSVPKDVFVERVLAKEFVNPKHKKDKKGYAVPKDKWKDTRYARMQNTPALKEMYDYMVGEDKGLMNRLMEHFQGTIIDDGYIPAMRLDNRKIFKKIGNRLGWYDIDRNDEMALFYKNNQQIRFIPIQFISLLKERKLYNNETKQYDDQYKIPVKNEGETLGDYHERALAEINNTYETNFTSFKKVLKANKLIEEHNKSLKDPKKHGLNISYDMADVIPAFIETATTHKYKKGIEDEALLMRDFIKKMKVQKATGRGLLIRDKYKALKGIFGKSADISQKTEATNYLVRFDKWLEMVLYDEFELDEGELTKLSRVVQNYTSLKGIGLNPFSALNNVVYGRIQERIEGLAGYHFTMKDHYLGDKMWRQGIMSYVADTYSKGDKSTSLQNAIIKYFGIIDDHTDRAINGDTVMGKLHKVYMKTNAFYLMQHMGEHWMQNSVLFAMMNSHRIVDGKILSFEDYRRSRIKTPDLATTPVEELRTIVKENKEETEKLHKEFEGYPKLIDAYELKDGFLQVKEGFTVPKDQVADFTTKVRGVNQKIHGIYNREDKGAINNLALGRLALQFRHWIRPGWNKRWGTRFGKSFWNERRNELDKGSYISAMQFFTLPFKNKSKQNWSEEGEWTAYRAAMAILRDYGKFIANAKVYWMSMSPMERANVKRAMIEMGYFVATVALLSMLKGAADDDDELKHNKYFNTLMYQLDRTRTELIAYSPAYGWFAEGKKIIQSPTATWKTFEDSYKAAYQALQFPFVDEDKNKYQSGIYTGKYKLAVSLSKLIPGLTVYQRMLYLEKANEYYKLF